MRIKKFNEKYGNGVNEGKSKNGLGEIKNFKKEDIISIGELNTTSGGRNLSIVFKDYMHPIFVYVSADEFKKVRGDKEKMKDLAIEKLKLGLGGNDTDTIKESKINESNQKDFQSKMSKFESEWDSLYKKIVDEVNNFVEENPDMDFNSFDGKIERFVDSLALASGWIQDRVNGIDKNNRKSLSKKISKALGY